MVVPTLETWHPRYYIVSVNPRLRPTRMEQWTKGIKRQWGTEPYTKESKEKLMFIYYPKNDYTESYIRSQILPKYHECRLCNIGINIKKNPKLSFKYLNPNNNNHNKNKKKLSRNIMVMEKAKSKMKGFIRETTIPYIGQGLAQIPKSGVNVVTTGTGSRLINGIAGLGLNIINEKFSKPGTGKTIRREMFNNMMWDIATIPTAQEMRYGGRSWKDFLAGFQMRSFKVAFNALFEQPEEIIAAIKERMPRMGRNFDSIKAKLGSYQPKILRRAGAIEEIPERMVESYGKGKYDTRSPNDISVY